MSESRENMMMVANAVDQALGKLQPYFGDEVELTLVARHKTNDRGHYMGSRDDPGEVIKAIRDITAEINAGVGTTMSSERGR